MRVVLASLGLVGALVPAAACGDAAADDHAVKQPGRVVRVEAPRRIQVLVPAGRFWWGIDENTASAAREQCKIVYPSLTGTNPRSNVRVDFCLDYYDTLLAMAPREVYVDAFWIDRDEVSVAEYRKCVAAGGCSLDPLVAGDERYIHDEWPMVNATWDEAQEFCRWRGGRLPSEAQWERAARGDEPTATWPWGELEQPKDFNHGQPRSPAMRDIERTPTTVPVHLFGDPDDSDGTAILAPPGSYVWGEGPYGTRDQAGNVAEWTSDAFVFDKDRKGYERLGTLNPHREGATSDPRIVRGGSWRQPTFVAKSNLRDPFADVYVRTGRFSHVGFRCVRGGRLVDTETRPDTPKHQIDFPSAPERPKKPPKKK